VAINHSSKTPIFDPSAASAKSGRPGYPAVVIVGTPVPALFGLRVAVHAELVAGRSDEANASLVLEDEAMSRRHARFVRKGSVVSVEDLGSTNGTFVNGRRLAAGELAPLDGHSVVRMGKSLLCVEVIQADDDETSPIPEPFVGRSAPMRRLYMALRKVAPSDVSVLVTGPTGTGKELAAEALHRLSKRAGRFVAVNCSAITATVAESVFFGHKKGAFTGATANAVGYFEQASGGTLFLDEVSELELSLQAKLLRVLETGEIQPLGGAPLKVSVRVVAASNVDLAERIKEGRFRADLYARIAVSVLRLPALDERTVDIGELFAHFVGARTVDPMLLEALLLRRWPLNVRELRNVAKMVLLEAGEAKELVLANLPEEARMAELGQEAPGEPAVSRDTLEQLLQKTKGNVAEVARALGKDRRQIYRWLQEFQLDPAAYR
jgi:DNA-binding NtrC family response regulator